MSRLALVAFAAIPVSLCGAASMAQATSVASPDIHFVVQVADSDSTTAGNSLATARYSVTLTGMLVASQVQLFVDNNPTALATGVADGSGNYSSIVSLPTDLIVGGHVITASGTTAAGIPFTNTVASFNVTSSGSVTPGSSGDGTLSLVVPASASSTLNPATLVNNISTSTGTLGQFSVNDQRTVSKQGWTLYADVTDFVLSTNPATTISKTQLGTAPQSVSGSTEATGITLGAATNPGAATYPMVFAEAAAQSSAVGLSTFDAALTFVAPQQYPVGTYNATVTITLVSK
ncbi:hypothetical protein M2116_000635 [Aurantimicrobium minutum]|uniref:hypothetical protein n=1 Tax=Aurantimicrobium minutum TaxID=708131 RepID=UPI0024075961|nr:hypothetical protein [Aurantimicrobium minutum]MDF9809691.1 hypothetical protein [Aurantimicrobium minutum]